MERKALLTPEGSVMGCGTVNLTVGENLTWSEYLVKVEFRLLHLMEAEGMDRAARMVADAVMEAGETNLSTAILTNKPVSTPEILVEWSETLRPNLGRMWTGKSKPAQKAKPEDLMIFKRTTLTDWLDAALGSRWND